jgi:hypothetical protein
LASLSQALAVFKRKIPISIVAVQTFDLLQPWLTSRISVERELVLFEGEVPSWLVEHCHHHQINIQAVHAGCLCCLGGPVLKTELIRAVRKYQPLNVLIVTGTQATLSAVTDALQTPMVETAFHLIQLFWLTAFEQIDPSETKTKLSKREFDNLASCSTVVLVNRSLRQMGGHSKASEFVDNEVLATWPSEIRFNRQHVLDLLNKTDWPSGLDFVFRSQRDWYRFSRSNPVENAQCTTLRQSNWRLNSQLISRETFGQNISDQAKLQIAAIIRQINDLSCNLSDPPETK